MCIRDRDCADCGLADCGLEPATPRFRDLGPPQDSLSLADSDSARKAQNAPLGSLGGQVRGRSWARAVP
eukprot:1586369-Alexandrium_andersonii.AAC.1